jgi:hypothetical protein
MRRSALVLALAAAGCSPSALPTAPEHPGSTTAPIGRLAGPPAALRSGVAGDVLARPPPPGPAAPTGDHDHDHDHGHDHATSKDPQ